MLIKTKVSYIDPSTVRAVRPYGDDGVTVYFKLHGDCMNITGITVDELAEKINKALSNPLFYDMED